MMDSANLPSQTDLNSLYGAWNPMSYIQGQQNQDLASQFRDQAYKANQNTVTEGALKNDQASQMNPLLLAQQGLTNTGLDLGNNTKAISNASAGIDLSHKAALAPDDLEVKRTNLQNQLGDEQYNALSHTINMSLLKAMNTGDTASVAKLMPMVDFLAGPVGSKVSAAVRERQLGNKRIDAGITEAGIGANATTNAAGIHVGGQIGVATLNDAERAKAAADKLSLQNAIRAEYDKPPAQRDTNKIEALTRILQVTAPSYGTAVNLPALQKGKLMRNADGTPAEGTADDPVVLK